MVGTSDFNENSVVSLDLDLDFGLVNKVKIRIRKLNENRILPILNSLTGSDNVQFVYPFISGMTSILWWQA